MFSKLVVRAKKMHKFLQKIGKSLAFMKERVYNE